MTAAPSTSTLPVVGEPNLRRMGYALTSLALAGLLGLAVVDALTPAAILGVDSATIRTEAAGLGLEVTYGEVSRPALATPFDIRVTRAGGFDEPVRIAVAQAYLRLWDENGLAPSPDGETMQGDWVIWEYDPPPGDSLLVTFDARIEPAAQSGRDGSVAVLDEDGGVLVQLDFTTRVLP